MAKGDYTQAILKTRLEFECRAVCEHIRGANTLQGVGALYSVGKALFSGNVRHGIYKSQVETAYLKRKAELQEIAKGKEVTFPGEDADREQVKAAVVAKLESGKGLLTKEEALRILESPV